jgi:hypothetical protein
MATIERKPLPPPNSTTVPITEADRAEVIARASDVIDYYLNGAGSYWDEGPQKSLQKTIDDLQRFKGQVIASKQFADDPHSIMDAIEALRRLGQQIWWNEATTGPGRDAIGFYHERKDDERSVGLGPEHDWSSHAADALGLMAICYQEPGKTGSFNRSIKYREQGWV